MLPLPSTGPVMFQDLDATLSALLHAEMPAGNVAISGRAVSTLRTLSRLGSSAPSLSRTELPSSPEAFCMSVDITV